MNVISKTLIQYHLSCKMSYESIDILTSNGNLGDASSVNELKNISLLAKLTVDVFFFMCELKQSRFVPANRFVSTKCSFFFSGSICFLHKVHEVHNWQRLTSLVQKCSWSSFFSLSKIKKGGAAALSTTAQEKLTPPIADNAVMYDLTLTGYHNEYLKLIWFLYIVLTNLSKVNRYLTFIIKKCGSAYFSSVT